MDSWPDTVDRAFRAIYYGGDYEREIAAFAGRWNGLETEAFTRALQGGTPEEKALALFALGYSHSPNAHALLSAALESLEPMDMLLVSRRKRITDKVRMYLIRHQ